MPLGIVNDDDFDKEVNNCVDIIPLLKNHGRGKGTKDTPEDIRKIIGETAITEGKKEALTIAGALGLSESSASAYANGATSTATYNSPDRSLSKHLQGVKDKITKRASRRLLSALSHITDEKLEKADPGELATVAKAMSAVINDMEQKNPLTKEGGPQFIVYAPRFISEDKLQTVHRVEE